MRSSKKLWLVTLLILAFVAVFALTVLGGCKRNNPGGYYLSVFENDQWTTYASDSEVPEANKLVQDEANESLYSLTIALEKGALVRIARVKSDETYGFSAVFSSLTALAEGADDAISVAQAGTFVFALNVAEGEISYQFTAKVEPPQGDEPGGDDPTAAEVAFVDITGVTGGSATILYNATLTLGATVTFDDGTTSTTNVTWASSNTAVATVANGVVTAKSAGTTQITAKSGNVTSSPVTVTVNGVVTLDQTEVTLNVGGTATLTATALGGATIENWRSSAPSVADVDDHGVITAASAGTATITVDYYQRSGSLTTVTCSVTVNKAVTGISLSTSALTVENGEEETLTVTIAPADATNQNYTFAIADGGDAIIGVTQDGKTLTIEGKSVGSTTITVKSVDGEHTASCTVTVVEAGQTIVSITSGGTSIDKISLHKTSSNTTTLAVNVVNGTAQSVAWESSATGVATVTASGESTTVTGVGFGSTTITATVTLAEGGTQSATCTVLVAPDNLYLYGDYGDPAWSSSVADLDSAGMVFAETADLGVYTLTFDLVAGKDFRIGHDDGFTTVWTSGFGYSHRNTSLFENMGAGASDNNIRPSVTGNYTITVDLTGASAKISIKCNSIAVTGIALTTSGDTTLQPGNNESVTINLTITPSNADYDASNIVWACSDTEGTRVTMVVAEGRLSVTVTVKATAAAGTVIITCTLAGQTSTQELTILAAGSQKTEVTSINFEQTSYAYDVATSGWSTSINGWTTRVKANVNEDASVQTVTYSTSQANVSVDENGNVVASKLGTYTITAISTDKTSVTTTTEVTFYSSQLYLVGPTSWTAATGDTTVGTVFEKLTLSEEADSNHKRFTLTTPLTASQTFQIAFIGMDANWNSVIKNNGTNFSSSTAGVYTITVDLSELTPSVSVVRNSDIPSYTATLMKGGTSVITSEASTFTYNGYAMTLLTTFEANGEYTIQVGSTTLTIASISGDVVGETDSPTTLFELASGNLKCVTEGKYRLTVLYDPSNDSCTVAIEQIVEAGWAVDESGTYGIKVSYDNNWGSGTWTSNVVVPATVYRNSATGAYEVHFSFSIPAKANLSFGLIVSGSWNNINGTPIEGSSSHMGGDATGGNYWTGSSTGTTYFKLEFTVSGGAVSMTKLTIGDSAFDSPVATASANGGLAIVALPVSGKYEI